MALERDHAIPCRFVEIAINGNAIAVITQGRLKTPDCASAVAELEARPGREGSGAHPLSDAGAVQHHPGKLLARIALARGRGVGMREHTFGANVATAHDRAAQG